MPRFSSRSAKSGAFTAATLPEMHRHTLVREVHGLGASVVVDIEQQ